MTQRAPGIQVLARDAEAARRALHAARLLRRDLVPARVGGSVVFAVDAAQDAHVCLEAAGIGNTAPPSDHGFEPREPRPAGYRDLVEGIPDELRGTLPGSFDVVGHVAVIKLPDELLPYAAQIGQAILAANRAVRTVARDAGVSGPFRVRALELVAGDAELTTRYREHGLELEVPLDQAYFSPRLATERMRVSDRILEGHRVLDMFAGIGAFVCLVARDRRPAVVVAIDLNPAACVALRHNTARYSDRADITIIEGDARACAPGTADFDHVVMNLPHDAASFLDVAAAAVADRGEVHLYAMLERDEVDAFTAACCQALDDAMAAIGRPVGWRLVDTRHVRNYAPTMDGLGFTFSGRKP